MRRAEWIIVVLLGIAGCASEPYAMRLAENHPANPAASTAPLPGPSTVLAVPESPESGDPLAEIARPQVEAHAAHAGHEGHEGHTAPATTKTADLYVCPMHPKVTSPKHDARCPICGMKLQLPKKKPEAAR